MEMALIYLILFVIFLGAVWVYFNNNDEIHSIAAISAGLIALIWIFILSPLWLQFFITSILFIICRHIYAPDRKT
ncbi:MAG TPA: hypothetical protein DDZ80_25400 [Cyanobacteria bacterium UBA8803]|nr:hypothetical protein [Cyanobacteria bacterium UBA9273]HBL61631.1 hypothetical protein [Cyanobacteria bacterium UBA8803]